MKLIVCCDAEYGIGRNGTIPWHCVPDMIHFKETTKGNTVVMGRKTSDSIPSEEFPLKGRLNIVLTKDKNILLQEGSYYSTRFVSSVDDVLSLERCKIIEGSKTFIIGGSSIYREFLERDLITEIILTKLPHSYNCDVFFPFEYLSRFRPTGGKMLTNKEEDNVYVTYYKRN